MRRWLAERTCDLLAAFPLPRGRYRLAQLAARLLDGVPIRSRYGPLLHTRFADSTFWLCARYGNDEVMGLVADLAASDGFIDVGANIGLVSCYAAQRGAAVLSLEPSPREFSDLLRNCALVAPPPPACWPPPLSRPASCPSAWATSPTPVATPSASPPGPRSRS